jgi:type I restriction enzyme S subunit
MKEGYKLTELGDIPESWGVERLEQYVDIISGCSPSALALSDAGRFNFYKVNQLNDFEKYMDNSPFKFDTGNLVSKGAIIFPKRGASIFTNKIRLLSKPAFFDTNVMSLATREGLDNEYLFYCLQEFNLSRIADTSSIPQINNKHINPLQIRLPPLPEQQKITSILSTVDEKIENIDAQITQTQQLKKALMQQLLTKGIGHTKFKSSELGDMPESWEVVKLGKVSDIKRGLASHQLTYVEDAFKGVRLIRINDFKSFEPKYIIETADTKNLTIKVGDVLMAGTGATAGISRLVDESWDGLPFSYNAPRIRAKSALDCKYLYYALNTESISMQQNSLFTGNAQPFLDTRAIASLKIPFPHTVEQLKIASILSATDEKIYSLQSRKKAYQQLKKGLMQQLLTGKLRVNTEIKEPTLA